MATYTKTYTEILKNNYQKAKELNKKSIDKYFCATSKKGKITPRTLELDSTSVFCEKERRKTSKASPEYQLQAFLVKTAKNNNWILPIDGKNWELIDAERNFAKEKSPKKFDLLAYSKKDNDYIILELKKDRNLGTAVEELKKYIEMLTKEISGANEVYQKNGNKVRGYVVYPNTVGNRRDKGCEFGIIEYPSGNILENIKNNKIKFTIYKETNEPNL